MARILVAFSSRTETPADAARLIVALPKEDDVLALYVVEPGGPHDLNEKLANGCMVGEQPAREVSAALRAQGREEGERVLETVCSEATKRGQHCKTELVEGLLVQECARKAEGITRIVLGWQRPFWARLRGGHDRLAREIHQRTECEVLFIDDIS